MARRRVSFSGPQLELEQIAQHHADMEAAVGNFFSIGNPADARRFAGYTQEDMEKEKEEVIEENERNAIMNTLAALEAAFRIDYLERCQKRKRDPLSRQFRMIYVARRERVSLHDDIFRMWKRHSDDARRTVSRVEDAYRYRNWLAHGRYWTLKIGDPYDYATMYRLAEPAFDLLGDA